MLSLLLNFALEYAIKKVRACEDGSKLNGTRQLLACADDATSLNENIIITEKNREKLSSWLSADRSRRKF